jgi:hypothetical protein
LEARDLSFALKNSATVDLLKLFANRDDCFVHLTLKELRQLRDEGCPINSYYVDKRRIPTSLAIQSSLKDQDTLRIRVKGSRTELGRNFKITNEFAFFLGLWMADGNFSSRHAVRLAVNEPHFSRVLSFLKSEFGYVPSVEGRPGLNVMHISLKILRFVMDELGFVHGSLTKRIPAVVFNWPEDLIADFLSGWYAGDHGVSTSDMLIAGANYLARMIGQRSTICRQPGRSREAFGRTIYSNPSWYFAPAQLDRLQHSKYLSKRKVQEVSPVVQTCTVYDLSVDTDSHTLFCGLSPILVHNSWDLVGGFPENLGGITLLSEFVAASLGDVEAGPLAFCSKGLHVYDFYLEPLKCLLRAD